MIAPVLGVLLVEGVGYAKAIRELRDSGERGICQTQWMDTPPSGMDSEKDLVSLPSGAYGCQSGIPGLCYPTQSDPITSI